MRLIWSTTNQRDTQSHRFVYNSSAIIIFFPPEQESESAVNKLWAYLGVNTKTSVRGRKKYHDDNMNMQHCNFAQ